MWFRCAVLFAALSFPLLAADEAVVRALPIKLERKEATGTVDKPTVIASAAQLSKAIPEKDVQARVAKEVDFSKQQVLFFAWTGSGTDKLTPKAEGNKVVFQYAPGVTDDVARHFKLFVLAKDATWKVAR
ncbi:MAG: hypothetical protein AB7K24_14495 [Gemmataceae bacterium]